MCPLVKPTPETLSAQHSPFVFRCFTSFVKKRIGKMFKLKETAVKSVTASAFLPGESYRSLLTPLFVDSAPVLWASVQTGE